MILLGCEVCYVEIMFSALYAVPVVGPILLMWFRRRKAKPTHTHEAVES